MSGNVGKLVQNIVPTAIGGLAGSLGGTLLSSILGHKHDSPPPVQAPTPAPSPVAPQAVTPQTPEAAPEQIVDVDAARVRQNKRRTQATQKGLQSLTGTDGSVVLSKSLLGS